MSTIDIIFSINESYLSSSGTLHPFQERMKEFADYSNKKRVALLSAPTGSGKTFGFKNMVVDGFIMILLPNNLLSEDVYQDFNNVPIGVSLLNAKSVNQLLDKHKKEGFQDITKDKVIEELLSGSKICISNPEFFYYLILNKYKYYKLNDSLTDLLKDGLRLIIVDEVHVYSRDQINIILAILKLINNNIKIMFSSATIPNYFKNLVGLLFDEKNVLEISAEREYKKSPDNSILQGQLNVTIPAIYNITDFIKDRIGLLKNGYWFIIADSIRNIQSIYNVLAASSINKDEIGMISAYHDSGYLLYKEIFKNRKLRIIIGSNIIEQGVNPPRYFNNYVIEPGIDIKNFIQRVGRIGRNSTDSSNLYIIFKNPIGNVNDIGKINTIDDLFDFAAKKLPPKNLKYSARYIGVYASLISQYFSYKLQIVINDNINKDRDGAGFFSQYYRTRNTLEFIKKMQSDTKLYYNAIREVPEIKKIISWWEQYYTSITSFIPDTRKVEGFDIEEKVKFQYDYIWARKNKIIINENNGVILVKGFNDRPDYDFNVSVSGLPFYSQSVPFRDVSPYKARGYIIDKMRQCIGDTTSDIAEYQSFIESLKDIIMATADYERLSMEVED
ncbi:CRISPR-associated helicase Cas3 [Ferroplasma acidiphilum]|uniref:CRISPR-associated helicase Cas3 n=1 Tax=Ferroplasma acidiphilum TaxID=74969 RepID=A0A1V0N412_9ARCH|nr:DEAD/DEAH box helicase [Ferroplasma acidiphilum]ARD84825.1 CRISPR-associated helicase Cas3 [Ferroplasma acidiphilum]